MADTSNAISTGEWYLFALAVFLIAVVYYVGVKSDVGAVTNLLTSVGNTYTGRVPTGGKFYNVP